MRTKRENKFVASSAGKGGEAFGSLAERFFSDRIGKGNAEQTIKHYQQSTRKIAKFLAYRDMDEETYGKTDNEELIIMGLDVPISVFDSDEFDMDFRMFLLEVEQVSEQTVSTYFRDYRAIAYFAMEKRLIKERAITVKYIEADIKEVYTASELDLLLKRPSKDCEFWEYRDWVVINYLLATGNRIGTIVNIKVSDLDFEENMVAVNVQKNKKKSRIPLENGKLVRILKEYIDEWLSDGNGGYVSMYLFPSSYADENRPMNRISLGRSIAAYNKAHGVQKTSVHLFRHTFVKNWIMKGGDLHSLQKIMGHSTLDMVTHYANLYDTDLKEKVDSYSLLATHKSAQKGRCIKRRNRN